MSETSPLVNAAAILSFEGVKVIPVDPATKVPLLKGWPERATDNLQILESWFTQKWPKALLGVPTGEPSGLWAIDIDTKSGGADSLARLVAVHGPLPDTVRYKTPGGHRYCFRWPKGVRIPTRASDIAPGIDVRGCRADGTPTGQIIIPPSVRADGGRYEWDGREGLWGAVDAPAWLLFLAVFNARERRALEAIGVTRPEAFQGVPLAGWHQEARQRLKAAQARAERSGGAILAPGEATALDRYLRRAIERECEALASTLPGKRQTAIGNAALAVHSLLKGAELEGLPVDKLEEWAFEQWSEARDALGPGEHTAEDASARWERCREDADARDLAGVLKPGPADEFEAIGDIGATAAPAGSLLKHPSDIRLDEILARQAGALVKGVLSPGDAAMSYGRSTAGKTFGVLDMCWHIACGKPEWHGRKVTKAPVLYVALEGVNGFDKRTLAAIQAHGDPGVWFARLAVSVTLVKAKQGKQGAATIVAAAKELADKCGQPVGLIVIDTAARATAGDSQNDSEAVMSFVEHRMGAIGLATGAAVMVVHHTNRSGDIRGALDWRNPMDVVLRWERDDDGRRCVAEKVKDGREATLFSFDLEEVELGRDPDGDPVTSCVVRITEPKPKAEGVKDNKGQAVFRAAYQAVAERAGKSVVTLSDVRQEFDRLCPGDGETDPKRLAASKRQRWKRALANPPAGLRVEGDRVCKTGPTDPRDEFEPIDGCVT